MVAAALHRLRGIFQAGAILCAVDAANRREFSVPHFRCLCQGDVENAVKQVMNAPVDCSA